MFKFLPNSNHAITAELSWSRRAKHILHSVRLSQQKTIASMLRCWCVSGRIQCGIVNTGQLQQQWPQHLISLPDVQPVTRKIRNIPGLINIYLSRVPIIKKESSRAISCMYAIYITAQPDNNVFTHILYMKNMLLTYPKRPRNIWAISERTGILNQQDICGF